MKQKKIHYVKIRNEKKKKVFGMDKLHIKDIFLYNSLLLHFF